jgi:hypothetical protein
MASQSVRVRVISLEASTKIANARLAEKIAERIAHHATVDPGGWEAFAAAEIKLALDAAARRLQ